MELSNEVQRTKENMRLIEDKLKVCEKQEDLAQLKIRTLEGKLHILETATKAWFKPRDLRTGEADVEGKLGSNEFGNVTKLSLPQLPL